MRGTAVVSDQIMVNQVKMMLLSIPYPVRLAITKLFTKYLDRARTIR